MAKEFKFQDPGEGIHEGEIIDVKVSEGDRVKEGQPVFEVETDKATTEAPSPFSGTIEKIHVKKGDVVEVGDVLITFGDGEPEKKPKEGKAKKEKDKKEPKKKPEEKKKEAADKEAARKAEKPEEEEKEEEDDREKREKEEEKPKKEPGEQEEEEEEKEHREEAPSEGPVPASPATRRLARELGVDLREVDGSGPGGRVTSDDVRKFAGEAEEKEEEPEEKEAPEKKRELPAPAEVPPLPDFSQWGKVSREPLRGIRRATAKQMALAWSQIPHVMHRDVADITELEKFRQSSKDKLESEEASLSVTIFVLKAAAAALREFPRFNASLDPEAGEIILKSYCHVGVAVDTQQGLVVPVIRDVDRKSIQELSKELTALVGRAREGELKREEMEGGSFTVTNPGPLGGTSFTPIINYPEVAILGLAKAELEPVVEGDLDKHEIVPRFRLPLCLAFDHRVNDGADAARFVSHIKRLLADPESFVLAV